MEGEGEAQVKKKLQRVRDKTNCTHKIAPLNNNNNTNCHYLMDQLFFIWVTKGIAKGDV